MPAKFAATQIQIEWPSALEPGTASHHLRSVIWRGRNATAPTLGRYRIVPEENGYCLRGRGRPNGSAIQRLR
jgi:hypothetical protein